MAAVSSAAAAHDFWLQPGNFRPRAGEVIEVAPMIGHGRERERWGADPRRIVELGSLGPAGRSDHYPSAVPVRRGENIRLAFPIPGVHVLGLATDNSRSELPAERFASYLREAGLDPILAERRARGATGRPGREIYGRCAKVIFEVEGGGADPTWPARAMGLKLEIVPESDLRDIQGAARLRVYYEGEPLAGALLKLWKLDSDGQTPVAAMRTDREGRVLLRAPSAGLWQLNVVWSKRLDQHPWADFETTFASLTFQAGRTPTSRP